MYPIRFNRMIPVLCLLAGLLSVPPTFAQFEEDMDFESKRGKAKKDVGGIPFLLRPAKDSAAEQLVHAEILLEEGKKKKAEKAFKALYTHWPNTPEAVTAKVNRARLLREDGELHKAAELLRNLVVYYAGTFPHDEVMDELFTIGKTLSEQRRAQVKVKGRTLIKGFSDKRRAIPIFETIAKHAPQWEKTPEVYYQIGDIRERDLDYEAAIKVYRDIQGRYPRSEWAEKAFLHEGICLFKLSEESPNSAEFAWQAFSTFTRFLLNFPDTVYREEALSYQTKLKTRIEKTDLDKARFYDKLANKPEAALRAYKMFARAHPNSEWTAEVESRIQELEARLAKSAPEETTEDEVREDERSIPDETDVEDSR